MKLLLGSHGNLVRTLSGAFDDHLAADAVDRSNLLNIETF